MTQFLRRLAKRLPPWRRLIAERDELLAAMKQLQPMKPPGHFNSPIPSSKQVMAYATDWDAACAELPAGIAWREAEQLELFRLLRPLAEGLPFTADPSPGHRYYYNNDWFCKYDALVLAAMLRHLRPRRVIEVGCGFSSALMLDVNDVFLGGSVRFSFIDPNPARLDSLLNGRDRQSASIEPRQVQEVPLAVFDELDSGDVLFVDSSHIARLGSDVTHLVFLVLPRLKAGVRVHFHDIFFPFEYPADWILAGNYWNEAYLLHAFLQYNDAFRIELFNSWVWPRAQQAGESWAPVASQGKPASLWLYRAAS